MTSNAEQPDLSPDFPTIATGSGETPNPLLMLHRALRGRYVIAALLGTVLGAVGAAGGWYATKPVYESQGWLRAFPRQPKVLYDTDENRMLPMFDAFMKSQIDLLRSRRVMDLAMREAPLREAGWPAPPAGVQMLIKSLNVAVARGSELIGVTVEHPDPKLAQAAANAVLDAFIRYHEEQEALSVTDRESKLRANQELLSAELKAIRDSIFRATEPYSGANIEQLHMATTEELTRLNALLLDPSMSLRESARSDTDSPGGATDESTDTEPDKPVVLTNDQLAESDQTLAALLSQRRAIELEIDMKSARLGAKHSEMKSLRSRLESVDTAISIRADELRNSIAAALESGDAAQLPPDPAARLKFYQTLRDQTSKKLLELSRLRMDLRELAERESVADKRLAETNTELEKIRVENEVIRGGRVRIQQSAATPIVPRTDRRMALAGGGFVVGFGSVFAGFFAFSLLQSRLRYADELQAVDRMMPLIGVIPEADASRPDEAESITLAIHHVRNSLLMMRNPTAKHPVIFLITSAIQGEGKTTLSIALGASFAQAGYRTTIVDGDLVGRGLSRELKLDHNPGLADALGHPLKDELLYPTGVNKLIALPAGSDENIAAHHLSVEELESLMRDLAERSDAILIDTGPILGSLEAGLIAQLCTSIVLVSSRGTNGRLVNAALDRARQLRGAGVALVFNRAHHYDLTTSASYSSVRSVKPGEEPNGRTRTDRSRLLRFLATSSDEQPKSNGTIM